MRRIKERQQHVERPTQSVGRMAAISWNVAEQSISPIDIAGVIDPANGEKTGDFDT